MAMNSLAVNPFSCVAVHVFYVKMWPWLMFITMSCLIIYVYKKYFVPSSPLVSNILFRNLFTIFKSDLKDLFRLIIHIGEATDKNGGISKIRIGPAVIYFVSNAEDALTILNQCLQKMFVYDFIVPYVGKEVVAADVNVFKKNKRILEQAFKHNVLNSFTDVFNDQAARLVQNLSKRADERPDILPIITRVILESVCQTIMGLNINGEDLVTDEYVNKVHTVLESLTRRFQQPWLIPDFVFKYSNLKKEQDEALQFVWKLSEDMVAQRKKEHLKRLKNNEDFNYEERKFKSFMDIILENSIDEDGGLYTDLQLRQLADSLLLAGFDTTSYELMYTLICLGSSSEVQEKAYQEVVRVIGDKEKIDKEDLVEFQYLEAVIKEALRLYPIGPVIAREADTDVILRNNVKISKGSSVVVHVWSLNRNSIYWGADSEEFRPERWLTPEMRLQHPAAFASFSPGKRTCIGKAYAMMTMKYMLAHMIRRFRFTADRSKVQFKIDVMMKLGAGHYLDYCSR